MDKVLCRPVERLGGVSLPVLGFPGIAVGTDEFAGEDGQARARLVLPACRPAAQQPHIPPSLNYT
jgi:hypothetical protein